jgi:hypothetical protein
MATLSLADSFFYQELQAALGHRQANAWLKRTLAKATTSSSESTRCTPTARSDSPPLLRRHATDPVLPLRSASDGKPAAQRAASEPSSSDTVLRAKLHSLQAPAHTVAEDEDTKRLKHVLKTGGCNAGLIFTDAAHCVFDTYVHHAGHM